MAKTNDQIKQEILDNITPNGNQEITGPILKSVLDDMQDFSNENVSVSQNNQTGHTEIYIGSDVYPVASVDDIDNTNSKIDGVSGTEVILSDYPDNIFDDAGTWKGNNLTSYCGFFIPCNGNGKIKIKANASYATLVSFVKEIGENGTSVDYSNGYKEMSIISDLEVIIDIPSDAKYIWLSRKDSGNNNEPQSVELIGSMSVLEENVQTINDDLYNSNEITWNAGLVNDNGLLKTSSIDKVSNPVFLKAGQKIIIGVTGDGGYFFACIAQVSSAETTIAAGTTTTPLVSITTSTCKYYTYMASSDMYVVLCVNGEQFYDIKIEEPNTIKLFKTNEIDLSEFQNSAWNDAGTWKVNNLTNYCGLFIPVIQGQTYFLKANANKSLYSLVKSVGTSATSVQYATDGKSIGTGYNINGFVVLLPNQIAKIQIPSDAKYLWVSKVGGGTNMLPQSLVYSPTTPQIENPLYGKKLAVDGDSICYGAGWLGGYAKMIGQRNCMQVQNLGVGGGTVTAGTQSGGTDRHWICSSVENLNDDADYVLIEGGVNDALLDVPLGSITPAINSTVDDETFYGAFESMLRTIMIKFQGKKYGYIFVHQAQGGLNPGSDYYNAAMACLTKYGVPYIDLTKLVPPLGMAGMDSEMVNKYTNNHPTQQGTGDGLHPSQEGYDKYYVPKIEAWMKTL